MRRSAGLFFWAVCIILALSAGCGSRGSSIPKEVQQNQKESYGADADHSPVKYVAPDKPEIEEADSSDFDMTLYPGGTTVKSGRIKGISPRDEEQIQAVIEIYTTDSIDDVIQYYRKRYSKLTVKDFDTDRGRSVIISDVNGVVLLPGPGSASGTTIVLTRDNEAGRTNMVYTGITLNKKAVRSNTGKSPAGKKKAGEKAKGEEQ